MATHVRLMAGFAALAVLAGAARLAAAPSPGGEDLFAGPAAGLSAEAPAAPREPAAEPPASPPPAEPQAVGGAEPPAQAPASPSGNPLWAIPLESLTASRERPLFEPTRRPPAAPAIAGPAGEAAPPPVEPERPPWTLVGTVLGPAKFGLLLDPRNNAVLRLKAGEEREGWVLRAVRRRQVELARGGESVTLDLKAAETAPAVPPP